MRWLSHWEPVVLSVSQHAQKCGSGGGKEGQIGTGVWAWCPSQGDAEDQLHCFPAPSPPSTFPAALQATIQVWYFKKSAWWAVSPIAPSVQWICGKGKAPVAPFWWFQAFCMFGILFSACFQLQSLWEMTHGAHAAREMLGAMYSKEAEGQRVAILLPVFYCGQNHQRL